MTERPFLTAEWRRLLVANFEVAPALLGPRVPPGTALDFDSGRCFVSLVAFCFERTRLLGVAVPFHTAFPEINLRFYVRRDLPDGPRRGVVFLRELVNRRAVAALANWAYNEKYCVVPIRAEQELDDDRNVAPLGRACYRWRAGGREHRLAARRSGPWRPLDAAAHASFVAEHYFGYGTARDGRTIEYRVAHPPWRVAEVDELEIDVAAERVYGPEFASTFAAGPYSAFLLDGSPVAVFRPHLFRARSRHGDHACLSADGGLDPVAGAAADGAGFVDDAFSVNHRTTT